MLPVVMLKVLLAEGTLWLPDDQQLCGCSTSSWLSLNRPRCPPIRRPVQSLVYAAAAAFLVRIVEPLHGVRELVKYLAATIVLTSFATVRRCSCLCITFVDVMVGAYSWECVHRPALLVVIGAAAVMG